MAKRTTMSDLNDHLFELIEDLKDEDKTHSAEELKHYVSRATAVNEIAKTIIESANLQLNAMKFMKDRGIAPSAFNNLLGNKNG